MGLFSLVLRRRQPPYTPGVMLGRPVSLLKYDVMKCYVSTIVRMIYILSTGSVVRFEHRVVQHVGPGKALSGRGLHFPPILTFHSQPHFRSKSFERHPHIAHNEPIESPLFLLLASCHSWRPPGTTDVYNNRTFPIPFNFSFGDIKDVFVYRFCVVVSVAIDLDLVNKVKSTCDVKLADDRRLLSAFLSKQCSQVEVYKQVHLNDTVCALLPPIKPFCSLFASILTRTRRGDSSSTGKRSDLGRQHDLRVGHKPGRKAEKACTLYKVPYAKPNLPSARASCHCLAPKSALFADRSRD